MVVEKFKIDAAGRMMRSYGGRFKPRWKMLTQKFPLEPLPELAETITRDDFGIPLLQIQSNVK